MKNNNLDLFFAVFKPLLPGPNGAPGLVYEQLASLVGLSLTEEEIQAAKEWTQGLEKTIWGLEQAIKAMVWCFYKNPGLLPVIAQIYDTQAKANFTSHSRYHLAVVKAVIDNSPDDCNLLAELDRSEFLRLVEVPDSTSNFGDLLDSNSVLSNILEKDYDKVVAALTKRVINKESLLNGSQVLLKPYSHFFSQDVINYLVGSLADEGGSSCDLIVQLIGSGSSINLNEEQKNTLIDKIFSKDNVDAICWIYYSGFVTGFSAFLGEGYSFNLPKKVEEKGEITSLHIRNFVYEKICNSMEDFSEEIISSLDPLGGERLNSLVDLLFEFGGYKAAESLCKSVLSKEKTASCAGESKKKVDQVIGAVYKNRKDLISKVRSKKLLNRISGEIISSDFEI